MIDEWLPATASFSSLDEWQRYCWRRQPGSLDSEKHHCGRPSGHRGTPHAWWSAAENRWVYWRNEKD